MILCKNILIITICFFLTACTFKFSGDTKYKLYQTYITDSLKIPRTNFDNIKFEARLWINRDIDMGKALFIMSFKKLSSEWIFYKYNIDGDKVKLLDDTVFSPSKDWQSKWYDLVKHKFLKLPTDIKVARKWKNSSGKGSIVVGGKSYVVELLSKNRKRRYVYVNPEKHLEYFDINVEELIEFNKCLQILNSEFHFYK